MSCSLVVDVVKLSPIHGKMNQDSISKVFEKDGSNATSSLMAQGLFQCSPAMKKSATWPTMVLKQGGNTSNGNTID